MYKIGDFLFKLGILMTGVGTVILIGTLILGFVTGGGFFLGLLTGPIIRLAFVIGVPVALLGALIEKITEPVEIKVARESLVKKKYGLKVLVIIIGVLFVGSSYQLFDYAGYGRDDQNLQVISIILMCTGFVLVGYGFIKKPTVGV